jgi:ABC-type multidrug transport system fused ATPase/permease subunit
VGLSAVALAPVPVALLLARYSGRWVTNRTLAARKANAAVTGFISERLTGLRTIRASGHTRVTTDTLAGLAAQQADAELAATALDSILQPIYSVLTVSGVVAVVWLGAQRIASGALTVGALVAFLGLFVRFTTRAYRIPQMANRVQAARAAYTRIAPLLAPAEPGPRRSSWRAQTIPAPVPPRTPDGDIRRGAAEVLLRAVDFAYPATGELALRELSLTLRPGELVAVTGPVGSGKSALATAVAGLQPIAAGTLTVDDRDPCEWTANDRTVLGYLPQGHPVFSGTVRDNVALLDPPADDGRFTIATGVAGLGADLAAWPEGSETRIGELGVRVSGGQRQRIALARALAAPHTPPGLLVLDDPFSAVDVATEAAIIAALREYAGPAAPVDQQATILLCSTRLAAFPLADRVVVLDAGRVVQQGHHTQLLAMDGLYARIWRAQLRGAGALR